MCHRKDYCFCIALLNFWYLSFMIRIIENLQMINTETLLIIKNGKLSLSKFFQNIIYSLYQTVFIDMSLMV